MLKFNCAILDNNKRLHILTTQTPSVLYFNLINVQNSRIKAIQSPLYRTDNTVLISEEITGNGFNRYRCMQMRHNEMKITNQPFESLYKRCN